MERWAASQTKDVLKGLVRSLEEVKAQRVATLRACRTAVEKTAVGGQIAGLEIALKAIKRRIR